MKFHILYLSLICLVSQGCGSDRFQSTSNSSQNELDLGAEAQVASKYGYEIPDESIDSGPSKYNTNSEDFQNSLSYYQRKRLWGCKGFLNSLCTDIPKSYLVDREFRRGGGNVVLPLPAAGSVISVPLFAEKGKNILEFFMQTEIGWTSRAYAMWISRIPGSTLAVSKYCYRARESYISVFKTILSDSAAYDLPKYQTRCRLENEQVYYMNFRAYDRAQPGTLYQAEIHKN